MVTTKEVRRAFPPPASFSRCLVARPVGHDAQVLPVPRDWRDLTPAWFTAALAGDGPGRVLTVELRDLADGTNARARAELTWAGGDGPRRVFVKREGSLVNRLALTALGAREAEADLARSGLELPLEHPAFLAAATARRRLAAVVVMADVTASGGVPHAATTPLTPDQVAGGLAGLARLHAAHWGRPLPAFVRPWRLGPAWAPVAYAGFVHALHKSRRLGVPLPITPGEVERGFRGWSRLARQGPQTLLHGDPHPGNTYRLGDVTGFYDWQLVRSGSWAHDVGYFLVSSLDVADRRAHERDLLQGYLAALGPLAPPYDEAWERYARTPLFGLGSWLQTLAAGSFQPVEVCLPTIERFAAAYLDRRPARASSY
jgi:hypothetical protein